LGRVPPIPLLYEFADHQREYSALLCAIGAQDCLEGNAYATLREESAAIGAGTDETDEKPSAAMQARELLGRLRHLVFRAYLDDKGARLIADATGHRRDLSRFMDIAEVFSKLVAGLEDEPDLLDEGGHEGG
jgi:hypothetical protein